MEASTNEHRQRQTTSNTSGGGASTSTDNDKCYKYELAFTSANNEHQQSGPTTAAAPALAVVVAARTTSDGGIWWSAISEHQIYRILLIRTTLATAAPTSGGTMSAMCVLPSTSYEHDVRATEYLYYSRALWYK